METYSLLREFADSWMLLLMLLVFVLVIVWAFRPGSRQVQDEIANSIFDHDKKPASEQVDRNQRDLASRQSKET